MKIISNQVSKIYVAAENSTIGIEMVTQKNRLKRETCLVNSVKFLKT